MRVSGLEVGGLFGSLLAGRISDWMVLRSAGRGGNVGKRVQVHGTSTAYSLLSSSCVRIHEYGISAACLLHLRLQMWQSCHLLACTCRPAHAPGPLTCMHQYIANQVFKFRRAHRALPWPCRARRRMHPSP